LLLAPAGIFLGIYNYHTAEKESRLAPIYVFAVLLAVTFGVWMIETISERWKTESKGVGRSSGYIRQAGFTLLIIALAVGIWIHLRENIGSLDYSGPNRDHASAVRIVNAVREPCIILSNVNGNMALQLLFCILTDPNRCPSCYPLLTEENQVDTPLAVTNIWSHEMAAKSWAEGKHLYSAGLCFQVRQDPDLRWVPVDTGVDPPELYEILPAEAQ
jgi:hypothetical protein